jgi:hypothetical protein
MQIENIIRLLAGTLVLISLSLSVLISPSWLFLALFVSVNLIQSAFTHFCPAEIALRRIFAKPDNRR